MVDYHQTLRDRLGFFQNRAIFKKTTLNEARTVNFPVREFEGLDMRAGEVMNGVMIPIKTKDPIAFRTVEVNPVGDGFYNFRFPKNVAERQSRNFEDLAPAQFIMAPARASLRDRPVDPISEVGKRTQYKAMRALVWKAKVRETNGNLSVRIDANERKFFDIHEGQALDMSVIPMTASRLTNITQSSFGEDVNAYRVSGDNLRVPIPDKRVGSLSEGDLVQCVATPA